ncbi:hypothetical protein KFE94_14005 [bacterium SCSIO 12643]|nr:hypothetical protein KFE94_14005 [bacterium SCSIO 12643]
MIFNDNISFFYVVVFIVVYNVAKSFITHKSVKNILLLLGSVVVLTTLTNIASLSLIILASIGVYYGGVFLSKREKNKPFLALFIGVLITLFVLKNYKIADFDLLQRVGLSYILFRLIHFLIESSKRQIHRYNLGSFLNYIIFFPTFIAGPIDEYNNFDYWVTIDRFKYDTVLFKTGLFKLFVGIIKKFVLVPVIAVYATDFALFEVNHVWQVGLMYSLLLYSAYIILDFSGYSDMAIGTAYLIGIKTPENFDNPYGAKNLSTFWKKWHMTFSNFLFKYVFKPVVVNLSSWFPNTKRLTISLLGYLITFTICGIWHGPTMNFIYWGLWHGVFLYFYKLWEIYALKKMVPQESSSTRKLISEYSGVLVTFIVVTIGWFFFNYQTATISVIGQNLFSSGSSEMKVSTVVYDKMPVLEVDLLQDDYEQISSIDIELIGARDHEVYMYRDIQPNNTNSYFVLPQRLDKALFEVNVNLHLKNGQQKQLKQVTYYFNNAFYPSELQATLFGQNARTLISDLKGQELMLSEIYLPAEFEEFVSAETRYFDGYGWAIQANYKEMPEYEIWVEYRPKGGEWQVDTEHREGKYNFYHIHGNFAHEGLNRHIAPGDYEIRLKYVSGLNSSRWFYTTVKMADYVNN